MTIGFQQIPLLIYVPGTYVEIDTSRAVRGVGIQPHETLVIGQMLGTAAAPDTVYPIDSPNDASILFGSGSQVTQMVKAYKEVDTLTPLSCIGIADAGAGAAAAGAIACTGTATETRELAVYVAGARVSAAVVAGDTADAIEGKIVAALELIEDTLPVTATGGTDVTLTARQKGTIGNQIFIGHSQLPGERPPAGITITVTPMSGGASDPSYTNSITAMGDTQYNTVVGGIANGVATTALVTEMETRWGPMSQLDGVLFAAYADTRANLTTLGNSYNSGMFVLPGLETSAVMQAPWETAAKVAAYSALRAQTLPSLALTGQTIKGGYAAKRGNRFTFDQRNTLLSDGVATLRAAGTTSGLQIERLVTTYQKNSQNMTDTALQDLTNVRTLSAMRYSFRARMASRFGQTLLASDGGVIPSGLPIITPSIARAEVIALAEQWVDLGWMEGASMPQFKAELQVERSAVDPNRLDFLIPPDLMNNLLVSAAKISFLK